MDAWERFRLVMGCFALAAVLALFVLILLASFADHRVRGYYLERGPEGQISVYNDVDWQPDIRVCTFTTPQEAVDFCVRANATLQPAR